MPSEALSAAPKALLSPPGRLQVCLQVWASSHGAPPRRECGQLGGEGRAGGGAGGVGRGEGVQLSTAKAKECPTCAEESRHDTKRTNERQREKRAGIKKAARKNIV
jgi:hypothetical protein